jgi:uncharacterized phage protein (TIGR02218 family)
MSYNAIEASIEISPVELYRFYNSDGTVKTYNSGTENITYLSETYVPELINSSDIELTDEVEAKTLTVQVPRKNSIPALFLIYAPVDQLWLTVYRKHINDPDSEYVVYWTGMVAGIEYTEDSANLICKPIDTAFNKTGLWRTYASKCQHMFGDARCKVNIALPQYQQTCVLTSVNGVELQSQQFGQWTNFIDGGTGSDLIPNGWWTTGYIQIPSTNEVRMITYHGDDIQGSFPIGFGYNRITLLTAINGLKAGDTVNIISGCFRDLETCNTKYGNVVNFGGFPFIPLNNPFEYKITS